MKRRWRLGLACALVIGTLNVAAQSPIETADELMASRPSMAGRSFNNPLAVQGAFEDQLGDARRTWGANSLQAADAEMLLGHATQTTWEKRKHYQNALRIVRDALPADHPLIGRYLTETAGGLISYDAYRKGDDYLDEAWNFYASAQGSEVEMAHIQFYRGLKSESENKAVASAQWYAKAALAVDDLLDTNEAAMELASMAHGNAIRVLELAGERDKASFHCRAVAALAAIDGNAKPRQVLLVPPPYPRKLLLKKVEGAVAFTFSVTTDGFVKNVKIESIEGPEEFGEALLDAIENWRFSPRMKDGEIVASRMRNRYLFSREDIAEP